MSEQIEIDAGIRNDVVILKLKGDLVASTADAVKSKLQKMAEKKLYNFVIVLADISFMDSSGLGVCMAIHKTVLDKKGTLVFAALSDFVKKIFHLTKAEKVFNVAVTANDAIKIIEQIGTK